LLAGQTVGATAQTIIVHVTPTSASFVGQGSLSVTVDWCAQSPHMYDPTTRSIKQAHGPGLGLIDDIAGQFTTVQVLDNPDCQGPDDYAERSTGSITLYQGGNRVTASVKDYQTFIFLEQQYYMTPAPPSIDASVHNGYHWSSGLCAVNCFDATVSYTTPAYVSLDAPRAVTVLYSSGQVRSRHVVQVNAIVDPLYSPPADSVYFRLQRPGGTFVTFTDGSTRVAFPYRGSWQRLAAQFEDSTLATGAYSYTALLGATWGSSVVLESSAPLRVLALNERGSPYGAGWTVAGLQRLKVALGDSLVTWDGTGSVEFWKRSSCDATGCSYAPPLGEFDAIRYTNPAYRSDPAVAYVRTTVDRVYAKFDDQGRLFYVDDPFGNRVRYHWLDANRIDSIIDPAGKATLLGYNGSNKLAWIKDGPGQRTTTITIDASNHLTQIQDPAGGFPFKQGQYDSAHRLLSQLDRRGAQWSYTYDFTSKLASDSTPPVLVFGDNIARRLGTTYRSPDAALLSAPADSAGIGTIAPPFVPVRTIRVDVFGALTQVIAPIASAAVITRNAHGQVTEAQDTTGHNTYQWDGARKTYARNVVTGATVNYQWDTTWNRIKRQYGNVVEINNYYNSSNGRLDSTRVGGDPVTKASYDTRGRVVSATDARGHVTQYFRDATTWLNTDSVKSGSRRTAYSYDSYGRTRTVKNAANVFDTTSYDLLNRVTRVGRPLGSFVTYAYEDSLNLTAVTDAKGQTYRVYKNLVGWDTASVDATGQRNRFAYDQAGQRRQWTNRRGQVTTFAYDNLGRDSLRTLADGRVTSFSYGPNWLAATNAEGSDTMRAVADTSFEIAVRSGLAYTVRSVYDWVGKVTTTAVWQVPSATHQVRYDLDTNYRALRIVPSDVTYTDTLAYNADGQLTTIQLHGKTNVTEQFRPGHDLAAVTYSASLAQASFGVQFVEDSLGRAVERDNGSRNQFERYTYDSLGRLTGFRRYTASPPCAVTDTTSEFGQLCTSSATLAAQDTFTYDVVGNRTDGGVVADLGNRVRYLRGDSLQYDADGNVTRKWQPGGGFDQYLYWNSIGQLDSVKTNGTVVTFGYDGFGRRVRKTVGASTMRYIYHGGQVVAEYDGSGGFQRHYTYYHGTDIPHSVYTTSRSYYMNDHRGNVTGLLSGDGTSVAAFYRYTPFGQTDSTSETVAAKFRFAGRELDPETGLYYNRARYYDPQLGRFVSEDPGGRINQYAYAGNDPVNHRDPSGQACEPNPNMASAPVGIAPASVPDDPGNGDDGNGGDDDCGTGSGEDGSSGSFWSVVNSWLWENFGTTIAELLGTPGNADVVFGASGTVTSGDLAWGAFGSVASWSLGQQGPPSGHTFFVKSLVLVACPTTARFSQTWMRTLWWGGDARYVEGDVDIRRATEPSSRVGGWAWYRGTVRAVQTGSWGTATLFDGLVMGQISCSSGAGTLTGFQLIIDAIP